MPIDCDCPLCASGVPVTYGELWTGWDKAAPTEVSDSLIPEVTSVDKVGDLNDDHLIDIFLKSYESIATPAKKQVHAERNIFNNDISFTYPARFLNIGNMRESLVHWIKVEKKDELE